MSEKKASKARNGSGESSPRNYNERYHSVASSQAAGLVPPTSATFLRGTDQGESPFTTDNVDGSSGKKLERKNVAEHPVKHESVATYQASPISPTTAFNSQPSISCGGQFQEEELDSKPPPVPHFLQQDDLDKAADVASEDNFHNDVNYLDNDLVDDKNIRRGLAMASGTPAYQPRREAAMAQDEHDHDIETAMGRIEPPTATTQAPVRPGAFREGGGPQDDDQSFLTTASPSVPQQRQTDIVAQAELVEERTVAPPPPPDQNLVIPLAEPSSGWLITPRKTYMLAAAIVILLAIIAVVVTLLFTGGDDNSSPSTPAPTPPPTALRPTPAPTQLPTTRRPTSAPSPPPMEGPTTSEPTDPPSDVPTPAVGGIPTATQQPQLTPSPPPQADPTLEPTEEAGPQWEQDGEDFVGDDPDDQFGSAVAVSGTGRTVVVGAPGRNYVRMHINPLSPQTITRPDLDGFGHSIAFSSSGDIIGGDIVAMASKDGTVLTYQRISTEFLQLGQELDGTSVSLSANGMRLAVTRQIQGNPVVVVFQFNESEEEWRRMSVQPITLDSPFGASSITTMSLAPDGLAVAIGVSGPDESGSERGFVQVYEMQEGDQSWISIGNTIDGPTGDTSYFGYSLSLLGPPAQRYLAVGAKYIDPTIGPTGRVRVFERTTSGWSPMGNVIEAETAAPLDGPDYSVSVSLRSRRLAIGEPFFQSNVGRVRVFQFDGDNEWYPVGGEIIGTTPDDMFGSSVSFGGENLAVGAPGAGRAQVYTLPATSS